MSEYDEYVEKHGIIAVTDRLRSEGIEYGVIHYFGADFFVGTALEAAARKMEDGYYEIKRWLDGS